MKRAGMARFIVFEMAINSPGRGLNDAPELLEGCFPPAG